MELFLRKNWTKHIQLFVAKFCFGLFLLGNFIIDFLKKNLWAVLFSVISIVFLLFLIFIFQPIPSHTSSSESITVKIPAGTTFGQVSDSLYQKKLIRSKRLFQLLGILTGKDQEIRSGLYRVPHEFSSWQILSYLTEGNNVTVKVTIPEGITCAKIAGILESSIEIDSTKFMMLAKDSAFARSMGVDVYSLEGYLMPETYYFDWQMSEREIVKFLVGKTLSIFNSDSVQNQLNKLDKSINEILTLASIIEGEVQVDSERVIVSSVYHNRLKRGWRLQADPTIQYILPGEPRRLTYRDLDIDSPYNTYKYSGLPPSPINNPGKKSILAALYPEETNYLYFVATGDGGHRFSRTSSEHAYWKRQFDRVRRKVRLEERRKRNNEQAQ